MLKSEDFEAQSDASGDAMRGHKSHDMTPKRLTARANLALPQRLGTFDTLIEGLDYAARGETGFNFYTSRGKLDHVLPYRELRSRAIETGRRLLNAGLKPGDRVSVVAETTPEFIYTFFGCQYAGLIPCPMPYSMYIGGRDSYIERLKGMMNSAGSTAAIGPEPLIKQIQEAADASGVSIVLSHEALLEVPTEGAELKPFGKDDVAYIQYSSGSTSSPKGVLISQKAITINTRGICESMDVQRHDRVASWLPLYHDMGLVGMCLSSMMSQVSCDYLSTSAFARRPLLWLKIMSDNQCTISSGPSFGYELAVRRARGDVEDYDLSAWRIAGIGGDMVRSEVLDEFAEKYSAAGFEASSYLPCYGMAEATLAVTVPDLNTPLIVDHIDRVESKKSDIAVPAHPADYADSEKTRTFIACGKPMAGFDIEVRDNAGKKLAERQIGHILIKGPSLMDGYYQNEEASQDVLVGKGWLNTGDMGYVLEGQIVITGRSKDLILHNGRNVWPQDIEWAVEGLESVRGGDVAAFSIEKDDQEHVVVLLQCRLSDAQERTELRRKAAGVVNQTAGVECDIVLVPPKSLPFTSSGKLSRAGAKKQYLEGDIAEIDLSHLEDNKGLVLVHSAAE